MLYAPHLGRCFGRGDENERDACPCPDSCWELCGQVRFDYRRSPRHERGRGRDRSYTPIPNRHFTVWGPPGEPEPSDGVKFTYVFLISRTIKPRSRWVVDSMADLAEMRGVSVKTLRQHCAALKRLDLIATIPYRLLSEAHNMNEHAIVLLDLPEWYQTPRDLAGPEPDERDEDDGGDLDDDDLDDLDDGGDLDLDDLDDLDDDDLDEIAADARPSRRRRAVDLDKVRRHRAALREGRRRVDLDKVRRHRAVLRAWRSGNAA